MRRCKLEAVSTIKKKILLLAVLFITVPSLVFSISFETRLSDIETHPDFWAGVFPSSVSAFIQVGGLDFLKDQTTEVGVRISTGTIARTLTKNPVDGSYISEIGDTTTRKFFEDNSEYDVMFASWNAGIAQGIGKSKNSATGDLLTLRFTLDGQWEVAMNPLMQTKTRNGYLFSNDIFYIDPNKPSEKDTLVGAPDLSRNRQLLSLSFNLYGKIDNLKLLSTMKSGISLEFKFTYAPSFLCLSQDYGGVADYLRFWLYGSTGYTIYRKTDKNGKNLFSFGLFNDTEIRVLEGKHVPKYAETLKGSIWFYEPDGMTFLARNTLRLEYYGQEFLGNSVPYLYLFWDISYAGGKRFNAVKTELDSVWTGSFGLHIELKMFDFMHIYYEIGYVFLSTSADKERYIGFNGNDNKIKIGVSLYPKAVDWSI
ncbi:MAG: hypothetical protein HUK24_06880 [Sphaerochaetaceae bacterium]|nr:hypothetical protein [Sphaerochaetaceae bacterium]